MTVPDHFHPIKQLKRFYLMTVGRIFPSDFFAARFPVSVKGICIFNGQVVLLKNEIGEWDLPGGKLERGEAPEEALRREIREELNVDVNSSRLEAVFNIRIRKQIDVLVILYICSFSAKPTDLKMSYENFGLELFAKGELEHLNLEPAYLSRLKALL